MQGACTGPEILMKETVSSIIERGVMMKNNPVHIPSPGKRAVLILISLVLIPLTVFISVSAGDAGGKDAFINGKAALEAGRYADAVTNLAIARQEFGVLGDYTLSYLAEAYHNLGEHTKALDTARSLLQEYPSSVLRQKARMTEIREVTDSGGPGRLDLLQAYVRDFPDDDEAAYLYGQLLNRNNEKSRAVAVFKRLYVSAGHLASAARIELSSDDITVADILERAANLSKQYDFADAERDLRHALSRCGEKDRRELLRNLASALFRQKKYREAADIFGQVNDAFFRARSLYRAGDNKGFDAALQAMTARNDKKAGYLLVAVAADKRREKDFDGALETYQKVLTGYPADAEDALWGMGWTQYLSGDHRNAAETFSRLSETYGDTKYRYWQARSVEATGDDAESLFSSVMTSENSFYAALAYARNNKPMPRATSAAFTPDLAREKTPAQERVDMLISLDMRSEAVTELAALSRRLSSTTDLLYSASLFQELGEYKRSISLATSIPYSEKMYRFWYPRAFWETVELTAERNGIDPYIVLAVMREESRFDPSAKSPAGAYGLMQLMPQTAYRLDRSLKLGITRPTQLTDAGTNIALGTYYLKRLSEEFASLPHALAAYNAGELAVRSWQGRFSYRSADEFIEDIPYPETRNYVKKVLSSYFQYRRTSSAENGGQDGTGTFSGCRQ